MEEKEQYRKCRELIKISEKIKKLGDLPIILDHEIMNEEMIKLRAELQSYKIRALRAEDKINRIRNKFIIAYTSPVANNKIDWDSVNKEISNILDEMYEVKEDDN